MGLQPRCRSADVATAVSRVIRALSICTPAALLCAAPAQAQTVEPSALIADIPARPLADALAAFARQTGMQLVYVSDVVRNRRSRAAAAGLSADEALARLLQGTGLRFEYLTPHTVRILAAADPSLRGAAPAPARDELGEVIVTASRREEDLRHVPIAVQVLTGTALAKLNATTFDDFVGYLPGVTAHGVGPGQANIYVRGLATSAGAIQSSGGLGTFSNVAVYLDDQSTQLPSRNLDLYAVDLERIEVMEGPQGTLFGAGAEAGVVRYITNKPRLDVTEGVLNAGYALTAHGAPSRSYDATFNLPLLPGRLAVRAVIYDERRGGYIDNRPATFARSSSDAGVAYYFGGVPANSVAINNFAIAATDINPVSYQGLRVEALYRFNEDWNVLLAQSYQSLEADGVFAEMTANSLGEPQPDLSAQLYNPSSDRDRFENTAVTVSGRLGALQVVYSGAYYVRNVEQVQDYTNYSRAFYVSYYQCVGPTPGGAATAQCFTPSATWREVERNSHLSHELRLTTPADWRVRGVGGLFYEDFRVQEQTDWFYLSALPYFYPIGPPTGYYTLNGSRYLPNGAPVHYGTPGAVLVPAPVTVNNPNVRPAGDGFFNDITRGYTQQAAFGSVDFDLVPNQLTLTAGTRYFRAESTEAGASVGGFGCKLTGGPAPPNPCINHSNFVNLDSEGLRRVQTGFRSRASLGWKISDDALLYYTWSQGYRAGGFNRSASGPTGVSPLAAGDNPWQAQAKLHGGWNPPLAIEPDGLTNSELGWKTRWLGARIEWDGAAFQEDWKQAQIAVFANTVISNGELLNGGDYRVRGIESSATARVTPGLTVRASAVWSHSEMVRQAAFAWADGTPIDFSTLRDSAQHPVPNPGGTLGSRLAGAPGFQGTIRARYEFALAGYDGFAQLGAARQSHSLASTDQLRLDLQGKPLNYDLQAYTTYDGSLGVGKEPWLVQLYAENLTDVRAELYSNYTQFYRAVTVNRPRTIGLRLNLKFGGS